MNVAITENAIPSRRGNTAVTQCQTGDPRHEYHRQRAMEELRDEAALLVEMDELASEDVQAWTEQAWAAKFG